VLRRGQVALSGTAAELRDRLGDIESTYLTGVGTSSTPERPPH
jgi:hypothetical protein